MQLHVPWRLTVEVLLRDGMLQPGSNWVDLKKWISEKNYC